MAQLISPKEIKNRIKDVATKVDSMDSSRKQYDKDRNQYLDSCQKILLSLEGNVRSGEDSCQRLYEFNKEKASLDIWDLRTSFSIEIIDQLVELDFDAAKTNEFISLFFPRPLNKRQSSHCSLLISMAIAYRHQKLLDALAQHVSDCDLITFPSQQMAKEMARDSPMFCAALISRGYFTQHQSGKDNLTTWLQELTDLLPEKAIVLNHVIRYSFFEGRKDSELNFTILNMIKQKKCEPLNNHLLIDLATFISAECKDGNLSPQEQKALKDRFGQLLIVALSTQMCSQSNQLKNILKDKFSDQDILIKAFAES